MPRALAVALALALATPAQASDFWSSLVEPAPAAEPTELEQLVATGALLGIAARELQRAAGQTSSPLQRRQARAEMKRNGDRAIALLERAVELAPDDADLHFALAAYYYNFQFEYYERDLPLASKLAEAGQAALDHWARYEQLAPADPRQLNFVRNAYPVSPLSGQTTLLRYPYQFERSIIYTKLGGAEHWERAIADYEYCLAVAPAEAAPADWTAQLLTNSAEILMALGRLDEAIERYEESNNYVTDPLYLYGLAVAYDRKGLTERAMDLARDALAIELATPMAALTRQGVFFIPDGDVHYYLALVFEAQGDVTSALLHYREFLARVVDSPYAEQAQRHIEQLTRRDKRKPGARERGR